MIIWSTLWQFHGYGDEWWPWSAIIKTISTKCTSHQERMVEVMTMMTVILMMRLMTVWNRCTSCQERTHNPMSRPSIWQAQQRFLLTDDDDGEDDDAEMSNCCLGSIQFALDSMWSHLAGRSSCETPPSRNKSGQMGPTIIDTEVLQCDLYLYQCGNQTKAGWKLPNHKSVPGFWRLQCRGGILWGFMVTCRADKSTSMVSIKIAFVPTNLKGHHQIDGQSKVKVSFYIIHCC